MQLPDIWREAIVVEPVGFADEAMHTVGAFTLKSDTYTILSLSPGEDFELNTDIIQDWKIVYQSSTGEILGDADYFRTINALQKHVLDQQNSSILIDKLTDDELHELFVEVIFAD